MSRRRALLAGVIVAALVAAPLVLGDPDVASLLLDRFAAPSYPAAPTLRLASPHDGDGVAGVVHVAGAASVGDPAQRVVTDVQYRLDGGPWSSAPGVPRGAAAAPFAFDVNVTDGDHLVEVRAADDAATSLVARAHVRSAAVAPPTVRIASPADGEGVQEGSLRVSGTVEGTGPFSVLVRVDQLGETPATVVGSAWSADLPLVGGVHDVTARAVGPGEGLPATVRVSAGSPAPPTLLVLSPSSGDAFGDSGSVDCPGACVLFRGVATGGATRVLVSVDGGVARDVLATPGASAVPTPDGLAWSWPLDTGRLISGEHDLRFTTSAPASASAPRDVAVAVHTARVLTIVGDADPRPTLTPLSFRLEGAGGDQVAWLLDGAQVGSGDHVALTLAHPGDHDLEADLSSPGGGGGVARQPLYAQDRPPVVIALVASNDPVAGTTFAAQAEDLDDGIASYSWDFGDGSALATAGPQATHAYAKPGAYVASVTATDEAGEASAPATAAVAVPDRPPAANFTWTPAQPSLLDVVRFDDLSVAPDGPITSVSWDFGEPGAAGSGSPARHQFLTRGDHTVALVVEDAYGGVGTIAQTVHVRDLPPVVGFVTTPALPVAGDVIRFADASTKPDGAMSEWRWDFGDGTAAEGPNATHAYARAGDYRVNLTVVDDVGVAASKVEDLVVAPAKPDVRGIAADPPAPLALDDVRFTANASDVEGPIVGWSWDFGDNATSRDAAPTHRYAHAGSYHVVVTVLDGEGLHATLDRWLAVGDAPPIVQIDAPGVAYVGMPASVRALASDADGRVVEYRFALLGDGTTTCDGPLPTCVVTYARAGTCTVWVNVTDDGGASAGASQTVDVLPPPGGLAPPTLRVDAPAAGDAIAGPYLVRGSTEPGGSPVRIVEVELRNGSWTYGSTAGGWVLANGTEEWGLLVDARSIPDGALDVVVRATGEDGAATIVDVPVTVANGPSQAPPLALTVATLAPNAILASDTLVRGSADPLATSVRWRIDEGLWRTVDGPLLAWSIPLAMRGLAPGDHVLHVQAWRGDAIHADADVPFTIAGSLPVLFVDSPPNAVAYGHVHAEGRATNGSRVRWRLDERPWQDAYGSANWTLDGDTGELEGGPHLVGIQAVDDESGLATQPQTFLVRVLNDHLREAARVQGKSETGKATPGAGALGAIAAAALVAVARRRHRASRECQCRGQH